MAKISQRKGKKGEEWARKDLTRLGVLCVSPRATPFRIIATKPGSQWVRIIRSEKVSGDLDGHRSDGVHILAEVKTTNGGNLTWSLLTKHGEHQAENLDRHARHAIALVVWVRLPDEIFILDWPIPGFGPGRGGSISPEQARKLSIKTKGDLDVAGQHVNMVICTCEMCNPDQISMF